MVASVMAGDLIAKSTSPLQRISHHWWIHRMPAATIQTLMDRAAKKRAGQNVLPSLGASPDREKGNEEQGTELLAY